MYRSLALRKIFRKSSINETNCKYKSYETKTFADLSVAITRRSEIHSRAG